MEINRFLFILSTQEKESITERKELLNTIDIKAEKVKKEIKSLIESKRITFSLELKFFISAFISRINIFDTEESKKEKQENFSDKFKKKKKTEIYTVFMLSNNFCHYFFCNNKI